MRASAKRPRNVAHVERLGTVVVAAGDGVVDALGGIVRVGAGLVLVVGLVVPGPVVEILVLVGGLGAVEPVDGHALVGAGVGGVGVVAGVDGGGAADHPEARAVVLDVGVAGRGAGLDEGVVVRDIGGRGVALGGGEEQQPELVAGAQAGGDEAPVRGDRIGGQHRRDRRVGVAGARFIVAIVVREVHLHLDLLARISGDQRVGEVRRAGNVAVAPAVHPDPLEGGGGARKPTAGAGGNPVRIRDRARRRRQRLAHLRRARDPGRPRRVVLGLRRTLDGDVKRRGTTTPSVVVGVRFIGDTPARGAA